MTAEKNIDILIVEDNQDDVFLTKYSLKTLNITGKIFLANYGQNAIEILNNLLEKNEKLPDLILLDMNLPKLTGLEVLQQIKSNQSMYLIPTVIFTSSDSISDMKNCYEHGADLYIKKPNNINEYKKIMEYITRYCFSI
ncbi:MAG: hypothetical protein A3B68_08635 [Candidatus Melainabacteria bacterium RIFCSPHIGHO2_02_FULL_34_12]|nr:MAG: hypothetical protein A3B68_08635 [Candidatus Melainabacteria bacterium RIFCSPHIGHO2_02_FULL_34_12]